MPLRRQGRRVSRIFGRLKKSLQRCREPDAVRIAQGARNYQVPRCLKIPSSVKKRTKKTSGCFEEQGSKSLKNQYGP
ncbi:unnamed protein product [Nesidiocoris tenuis]|uniref:Uncharacterized protein n=1 Tax=Nesidiocoris tenuis TaxID=355587 RepID=A0A6H5HMJ7_9HEMI|nr:unnamed protein product [Nesidiocoris tenuis]